MGLHVPDLAGIELDACLIEEIVVGGLRTVGNGASVQLELRRAEDTHLWSQTIYFCDPWPWAFGLLGLSGLDPFLLTLDSYEG